MAEDSKNLQRKLTALNDTLQAMGMALNPKKSHVLTILKDRRRKCLILSPTTYWAGDGLIDPVQVEDHLRYLGLEFNWKGRCTPKHTNVFQGMLCELSKVPLKPYQQLEILKLLQFPN